MVWFKRIVLTLLITLILLVSSGIIIVWVYGDRMKEFVMDTARSNITTQMGISDDIRVSFWKDFPRVSVELRDVWVQDSFRTDTLLKAQSVFVQLDIIKVLTDRLVIEGIRVTNGFAHIRQNGKGDWNYTVWEKSESDGGATDVSIDLLAVEDMDIRFASKLSGLRFDVMAYKAKMSGRFTDETQNIELTLDGKMIHLFTSENLRVKELPLNLTGVLRIQDEGKTIGVEMGNAELAGNEVLWSMLWQQMGKGSHIRLSLQGEGIEPDVLLPHIWPTMPETVRQIQIEGTSNITLTLEGPIGAGSGPKLSASWKMEDGGIVFRTLPVTNLNFEATIHMADVKRAQDAKLTFKTFSLRTPKGEVTGSGTLTNLNRPQLSIRTKGRSRIEEIVSIIGDSSGIEGAGAILWDIAFDGPLGENFKTTKADFQEMLWSGTAQFSDVDLDFGNGIPPISDFHGQVVMEESITRITEFSGQLGHLVFDGQMELKELREVLANPLHPLQLKAEVSIEEIDVEKLPSEWTMSTEKSGKGNRPVVLNAKIDVGKVVFKDFTAEKVKGNLNVNGHELQATDLRLNALGGTIMADLNYTPQFEGAEIYIDAQLKSIDISRLLSEWDNFGQTTITSKHLRGKADADMQLKIPLDAKDNLKMNDLRVECDLRVSGGELINFEPLQALSRFISVEELQHVRFDTIVNHFSISNQRLVIPYMKVNSSILNVEVYGEHSFKQELDYHVNLLLNDLIRRKARKKKFFEDHEIQDERGTTRLYLWIRGKPGDITVGFDKKEVRLKVKEELRKEGSSIKQLFQDEFGARRNKSVPVEDEPVQFRLQETSPTTAPETKVEQPSKPKKKGFSMKEEEEETEGQFELDNTP